ncbi:MAG: COG1361 S-layer family protein [Halobacteria archaeon]|nr:COG1361 S-layer family protein [Halobacteria archaeon]
MRDRRAAFLAILITVAAVASVGTATAADSVIGSPEIDLTASDHRFLPGEERQLRIDVLNDGNIEQGGPAQHEQRVKTARGMTMEVRSGNAPIEVKTGKIAVGTVPAGTKGPYSVTVTVPENATPGTYRLPVDIEYRYTRSVEYGDVISPDYNDFSREETKYVEIRVIDRARFEVVESSSDVLVGDTGTMTLDIKNVGTQPARNAEVSVTSNDAKLSFSGSSTASSEVGFWEAGETKTVKYRVGVNEDAIPRRYSVTTRVSFDDTDGISRVSDDLSAGLLPSPEQEFEVVNHESDLRVGEEGRVSGEVVYSVNSTVSNAVVTLQSSSPNINPTETEYAVGDLGAGESKSFNFTVEVNDEAEAGSRQLSYVVRYRNQNGDIRRSDPVDVRVDVGEERDEFLVEPINATVEAGGTSSVEMRVTNNQDETVTDINAKIFTNDPLSSGDDEAFISSLKPGESSNITFGLSAGGGALPKTYPISIDFSYDETGDQKLSDTYSIPVDVTQPDESGGLPLVPIAVVVVVVLGALWWWRR